MLFKRESMLALTGCLGLFLAFDRGLLIVFAFANLGQNAGTGALLFEAPERAIK